MDIVLGNYKGLKANIPYIAYTEEDVNSQIATLLSGNPVTEQKTDPLAMGDTAVIDYEGFKDGDIKLSFPEQYLQMTGKTMDSLKDELKPDLLRMKASQLIIDASEIIMEESGK